MNNFSDLKYDCSRRRFMEPTIVDLNSDNMAALGCPCFMNLKHPAHISKIPWVVREFSNGLKVKHMLMPGEKKPIGFIEYTHGENAWRAVEAKNFLFIHCIWITPNKFKDQGYGSLLIQEVIKEARRARKQGVAVIAGDDSFIAEKNVFLKNKFELIESNGTYQLLAIKFTDTESPKFKNWEQKLVSYQGFHLLYSEQCPWVIRLIDEIQPLLGELRIPLKITKIESPQQAQEAPSIYSAFNLIYNGKLLSDHYISVTRFKNILKKEKILQ